MKREPRWKDWNTYLDSIQKGGVGAALGVWRGATARETFDIVKPSKFYLVDWWAQYSNSSTPLEQWEKVRLQALARFPEEIKSGQVEVIREDFVAAALHVPSEYIDFLRHNGDEREAPVAATLRAWWRTLKKGGLWCGHGFDAEPWHGTIPAVVRFLRDHPEAELLAVLRDCSHYVLRKN